MSNQTKWTPGPWVFHEASWCEGHGDINSDDWASLACVVTHNEHGKLMRNGEGEANAHLIAAAPELYEALSAFERVKELWLPPDTVSEEHFGEAEALHGLRNKMLNALAKARGES